MEHEVILAVLFFVTAVLYSSVGQAGASGYLAVMALMGVAATVMKPTALTLNILVATIAAIQFYRADHISWAETWPFLLASVPLAFLGGVMNLPSRVFQILVGVILLIAAAWSVAKTGRPTLSDRRSISAPAAVVSGGIIGWLAGLTGMGGGILLSPVLLLWGRRDPRRVAGTCSAFILLNSAAGLAGNLASMRSLPPPIWMWSIAAVIGAVIGSELGSRKLAPKVMGYLLAAVLIVAGTKLILL